MITRDITDYGWENDEQVRLREIGGLDTYDSVTSSDNQDFTTVLPKNKKLANIDSLLQQLEGVFQDEDDDDRKKNGMYSYAKKINLVKVGGKKEKRRLAAEARVHKNKSVLIPKTNDEQVNDVPVVNVEIKERKSRFHSGFYRYDNHDYFVYGKKLYTLPVYPVMAPSAVARVSSHGVGWCELEDSDDANVKFNPIYIPSPSEVIVIPEYVRPDGIRVPAAHYDVLSEVFEYCIRTGRITEVDAKTVEAISNIVSIPLGPLPPILLKHHVHVVLEYARYKCCMKYAHIMGLGGRNPSSVLEVKADVLDSLMVSESYYAPLCVKAVDFEGDNDFVLSDDVEITGGDATLSTCSGQKFRGFDLSNTFIEAKKKKTVLCRFMGPGKFFKHYDNSDTNKMFAIKRMVAETKNNEVRKRNQLLLGSMLSRAYPIVNCANPLWDYEALKEVCHIDSFMTTQKEIELQDQFFEHDSSCRLLAIKARHSGDPLDYDMANKLSMRKAKDQFAKDLKSNLTPDPRHSLFKRPEFTKDVGQTAIHAKIAEAMVSETLKYSGSWFLGIWRDILNYGSSWTYLAIYENMITWMEPRLSRVEVAELEHIKRALRKKIVEEMGHNNFGLDDHMARLEAMIKDEFAKPGKVPRLFVDYGAGCMYANELPEFVKKCTDRIDTYYVDCERYDIHTMSVPRMKDIQDVFNKIANGLAIGQHIIVIYSDDSVYSGHSVKGFRYVFNVDISSCDASCGPAVFFMSGLQMSQFDPDRARGLIDQCNSKIKLRSNRPNVAPVLIKFKKRNFEGSGTTLTGINNNNAGKFIALSYVFSAQTRTIEEAAIQVGFIVTVSENFYFTPEKIQFLKLSPLRTECGEWVMTRNYGCITRKLGTIDGEMLPKQINVTLQEFRDMPWTERMERFVSSAINSQCHEPRSIIMDALRGRFTRPTCSGAVPDVKIKSSLSDDKSAKIIESRSLCVRYDVELHQLQELADNISKIQLGDIVVDPVIEAFYRVDYEL